MKITKQFAAEIRRTRRNLDKASAAYDAVAEKLKPIAARATLDNAHGWLKRHVLAGTRVTREEYFVMSLGRQGADGTPDITDVPARTGKIDRLYLGRVHYGAWIEWDGQGKLEFASMHELRRMIPGLPECPKPVTVADLVREIVPAK